MAAFRGLRNHEKMQTKKLTPAQALANARNYCSYQERSHNEVKEKLFGFGLTTNEVENIVAELISDDFLNEERFARAFARGKFNLKGWGKVKIRYELKQRRVSDYCIRKGLTEIDDEEYEKKIKKLFEEKLRQLKREKNAFIRKRKLMDHLLQKGYERDLIQNLLKE